MKNEQENKTLKKPIPNEYIYKDHSFDDGTKQQSDSTMQRRPFTRRRANCEQINKLNSQEVSESQGSNICYCEGELWGCLEYIGAGSNCEPAKSSEIKSVFKEEMTKKILELFFNHTINQTIDNILGEAKNKIVYIFGTRGIGKSEILKIIKDNSTKCQFLDFYPKLDVSKHKHDGCNLVQTMNNAYEKYDQKNIERATEELNTLVNVIFGVTQNDNDMVYLIDNLDKYFRVGLVKKSNGAPDLIKINSFRNKFYQMLANKKNIIIVTETRLKECDIENVESGIYYSFNRMWIDCTPTNEVITKLLVNSCNNCGIIDDVYGRDGKGQIISCEKCKYGQITKENNRFCYKNSSTSKSDPEDMLKSSPMLYFFAKSLMYYIAIQSSHQKDGDAQRTKEVIWTDDNIKEAIKSRHLIDKDDVNDDGKDILDIFVSPICFYVTDSIDYNKIRGLLEIVISIYDISSNDTEQVFKRKKQWSEIIKQINATMGAGEYEKIRNKFREIKSSNGSAKNGTSQERGIKTYLQDCGFLRPVQPFSEDWFTLDPMVAYTYSKVNIFSNRKIKPNK